MSKRWRRNERWNRGDVDARLGGQPMTSRRYPQIATATSFQFPVGAVA